MSGAPFKYGPIGLALVAAYVLIRILFARTDIDPAAKKILLMHLRGECKAQQFPAVKDNPEEILRLGALCDAIEITRISARGKPESTIFKVELAPHPIQPAAAANPRYFEMKYSMLTGWGTAPLTSSALGYHLARLLG